MPAHAERMFGKRAPLGYPAPMLTSLRALAGTWFAKVLFLLLILSFAAWGIEDMLRTFGRDTAVARVDGKPIEQEEASEALRRELQRINRATEGRFQPDARIRAALAQQAVDALVTDRVLAREITRMGVVVPDAAVRDYIFSIPGFQGADGRFSRLIFDNFLLSNDLTEPRFLGLLRTDLARQQLTNAVRAGAMTPALLAERLLGWQLETRSVNLVELRIADAPEPDAPSAAQLERFHENNADRFSAPEFREVGLALMNAALLVPQMEVSEREIEDSYAAHRNRYETAERRGLQQVLVPSQAAAFALAAAWAGGADTAAITVQAEAAAGQFSDLGIVDRAGLPLPALTEAGFALALGGVSAPVETPFGWHVLRAANIQAGTTRPLETVREELRLEIAAEKAADTAFERSAAIQDALASGASLAEIAERQGMTFLTIRIDARGRDADGRDVALPIAVAARPALLQEIFQTAQGAAPRLTEGEFGFAAMELRSVTPAALRPLESIRAQVNEAFLADARRRFQEQRAAAILAATRAGKPLAEAVAEAGAQIEDIGPFGREAGGGNPIPRELLPPIFELRLNEVSMIPAPLSFAVVQLTAITRPGLEGQEAALTTLRNETATALAGDLEAQFGAALRARSDVRFNLRLMNALSAE